MEIRNRMNREILDLKDFLTLTKGIANAEDAYRLLENHYQDFALTFSAVHILYLKDGEDTIQIIYPADPLEFHEFKQILVSIYFNDDIKNEIIYLKEGFIELINYFENAERD